MGGTAINFQLQPSGQDCIYSRYNDTTLDFVGLEGEPVIYKLAIWKVYSRKTHKVSETAM